ncbi:hypothetical protein AVEN_41447-1 [Araneus ventricosus]|uniref:Uncharacterized protein n=1 Tax=Araneus ventricosus TaxID=182803 RepID=A0A4Y2F3I5_ARAVE|nr:hypothetical protein AVEN_41447-1 [Araneus ventricosus]
MKVLLILLVAGAVQCAILPFLQTPKHDGVKRVCQLTADNFTTVVNAADISVIVVKDPLVTTKSPCPNELETFAEIGVVGLLEELDASLHVCSSYDHGSK